jgi:hypothetical protein
MLSDSVVSLVAGIWVRDLDHEYVGHVLQRIVEKSVPVLNWKLSEREVLTSLGVPLLSRFYGVSCNESTGKL